MEQFIYMAICSRVCRSIASISRASALLCKECTLLVRIQLSRKNANHPNAHLQTQQAPCVVQWSLDSMHCPYVERDAEFRVQGCWGHDPEAQWDLVQADWLSIHPSSKERLPHHDIPAPRRDIRSMSCVQSRIAKALSTCLTRIPAWLSQLDSMSIHSERRELRSSMDGSINPQRLPRMHGHGKKVRTLPNGQELEALPGDINLFQSIRQIVPIQRRKPLPWGDIGDLDTSFDHLYPVSIHGRVSSRESWPSWDGAAAAVHEVDREDPRSWLQDNQGSSIVLRILWHE